MTDDLVTRLRYQANTAKKNYPEVFRVSEDITYEAADRIEKLEAALREIMGTDELSFVPPILRNVARKALEGKDD